MKHVAQPIGWNFKWNSTQNVKPDNFNTTLHFSFCRVRKTTSTGKCSSMQEKLIECKIIGSKRTKKKKKIHKTKRNNRRAYISFLFLKCHQLLSNNNAQSIYTMHLLHNIYYTIYSI